MKHFLYLFIALFFPLIISVAHAAPTAPEQLVSFAPADAKAGDTIALNALVYNNTTTDATVLVVFTTAAKDRIGGQSIAVPAQSARTASVSWKVPTTATVVTATVSQATDSKNREIASLEGDLGTVTVGSAAPVITAAQVTSWTDAVKQWLDVFFSHIEVWRMKEANYFAGMRDANKTATTAHPVQYATYAGALALAALFASTIAFYIVFGILVLVVVRFIFRLIL